MKPLRWQSISRIAVQTFLHCIVSFCFCFVFSCFFNFSYSISVPVHSIHCMCATGCISLQYSHTYVCYIFFYSQSFWNRNYYIRPHRMPDYIITPRALVPTQKKTESWINACVRCAPFYLWIWLRLRNFHHFRSRLDCITVRLATNERTNTHIYLRHSFLLFSLCFYNCYFHFIRGKMHGTSPFIKMYNGNVPKIDANIHFN